MPDDKKPADPKPALGPPTMFPPREGQVVETDMGKRVWRKNEDGMMVLVPVTEH